MKKLLKPIFMSIALFFGFAANATVPAVIVDTEVSFAISNISDSGGQVYYSCSAVESAAEDLAVSLQAMGLSVSCSGGLENGSINPVAFLRMRFSNFVSSTADKATHQAQYVPVSLKGRETSSGVTRGHSCHLMKDIFRNVEKSFDLKNVKARFRCSSTSFRSYKIELDALALN